MNEDPAWFKDEAISNYITFFLGVVVTVIGYWIVRFINRKRASKIIVERRQFESLVFLSDRAKNRIVIYNKNDEKVVENLHLTLLRILNGSDDTISDIGVRFFIANVTASDVLEIGVSGNSADIIIETSQLDGGRTAEVTIPYLNSHKQHNDERLVEIFSSTPIAITNVEGKGKGWSITYKDVVARNQRIIQSTKSAFLDVVSSGTGIDLSGVFRSK